MMKFYPLFVLSALLFSCAQESQKFDSYGLEISEKGAISTAEFLSSVSDVETEFKVKGTIQEVCQMKGCWMTLKNEDDLNVRVTFKDYGFFVPKDAGEQEVILEGVAFKEVLDEETARHYAEDGNQEYDESMRSTISFVAEGVLIAAD